LQLDLQKIALAYVACVVTRLADVHRVLEALEILQGQLKSRLCELNVDEQGGNAERKTALIVGDLRPCHGRQIPGRPQAVLPLFASLKQIADPQVELGRVVEVIRAKLTGLEDRQELPIA
jgi:hypothetical protein